MNVTRDFLNSSEMSKLTIDSMVDHAIYILDKKGRILSANAGSKNLTGYQSLEISGTHFAKFYTAEDINRKYLEHELRQAKKDGHYDVENWFVKKDSTKFWANIVLNRLNDSKNAHIGYSVIVKDLTDKKIQEDALRKSELSAIKALKLKSQFIADISHEIRTPLGAMLGFAEFLQKENIPEQDRMHYLDVILKNGKNLNKVINDVLDLSKIEAGRINIELDEFNLNNVISDVVELFLPQCNLKNISITFEKHDLNVNTVMSDPTRIRQILNNIIGNAIKFTDKGSISISLECLNEAFEKNEFRILIKDTGIGLDQKELIKIFKPFSQVKNTERQYIKGSGLGLILSRKMAQALGGNLELVNTTPGEGSTFSITFTDYKTLKKSLSVHPTKSLDSSLKAKSILVVDDSIDNLEIIKLFLNSYGGNPDLASDGQEALQKIQKKNYDVILLDVEMPQMNGFQVIKELQHRKYKTPVIALTAHALPEDKIKTKNAGFFDHVTKPIDFNYLVSMIETLH